MKWIKIYLTNQIIRYKIQIDKHCKDFDFDIDNWIYLPKKNMKTVEKPNEKLDYSNLDFYKILKKIGYFYRLNLFFQMKMYNIFYTNRLRKIAMNSLFGQL